ncbi:MULTISPECIES: hypothetical protein [unclassified Ruegeria]|uniref:hypothetical protein n=1 Tax=unclassified Ruegeria TaxID=2625375 RepID=UPI00148847AB|nr:MULTISPECIES: hypothetical protein [unclassified Ruegeria]NOD63915.1 hypothetical protein [Ruegeria sp. HKCCD6109]NOD76261.1 hypothetical protein [Ruegeria sp. HKCCD4332]NOD90218.1 hypothetical protein [Ruegeria sp. HKCCD4318]NOD94348.1 hypothetical protein [Ruegeria sp. HKCCD4884]NOE15291.1 hypothetical protein [Ruegeria sp. HKCCD4318-2]
MGLEYDFDIVKAALDDFDSEKPGAQRDGGRQVHAVFRDIRTADALRGTSPKIRKMFLDAGFSLESRNSGIVPGVFPAEDQADRVRVLRSLFANIKTHGVRGEYCGEFDLMDFLTYVRVAQPMAGIVRARQVRTPPPKPVQPSNDRRTVPGRIGLALGLAVVLFVILKLLAAAGTTP